MAGTARCRARICARQGTGRSGSGPCQLNRERGQAGLLERLAAADRDRAGRAARSGPRNAGEPTAIPRPRRWPIVKPRSRRARPGLALLVDDRARRLALGPAVAHEVQVIVVGHEADLLAVGLVMDRQAVLAGDRPDLGLGITADREQDVRQQLRVAVRRGRTTGPCRGRRPARPAAFHPRPAAIRA